LRHIAILHLKREIDIIAFGDYDLSFGGEFCYISEVVKLNALL